MKSWAQPYSNWKISQRGNQVVTFYVKEKFFWKRRINAKPNSNFLNFFNINFIQDKLRSAYIVAILSKGKNVSDNQKHYVKSAGQVQTSKLHSLGFPAVPKPSDRPGLARSGSSVPYHPTQQRSGRPHSGGLGEGECCMGHNCAQEHTNEDGWPQSWASASALLNALA